MFGNSRVVARVEWNGPKVQAAMVEGIKKAIIAGCAVVEKDAKESMVPGSGRQYKRPGGKIHYASAPGEPPAVDTGRLRASITSNWTGSGMDRAPIKTPVSESESDDGIGNPGGDKEHLIGVVGTNAAKGMKNEGYGYILEVDWERYGAERPYLRPALEKNRQKIMSWLERAFDFNRSLIK